MVPTNILPISYQMLWLAIEVGYRLFDCAAVYGNEDEIGKVFENAQTRTVKEKTIYN